MTQYVTVLFYKAGLIDSFHFFDLVIRIFHVWCLGFAKQCRQFEILHTANSTHIFVQSQHLCDLTVCRCSPAFSCSFDTSWMAWANFPWYRVTTETNDAISECGIVTPPGYPLELCCCCAPQRGRGQRATKKERLKWTCRIKMSGKKTH